MQRDLDVVCLGEALVDFLPERRGRLEDCDRFEACPGGAPANVATGLARLGARVAFRGVLGDDPFGRLLVRKLEEEGVRCAFRLTRERPTGIWFVALDARGERSFFSPNARFSADKLVAPGDVDRGLLSRAAWLHVGSSAHVLPEGQEALRAAVAAARSLGLSVSFDPNVRAHLWDDLGALRRLCADVVPACTLVKVSEEEAELVTGEGDPARAAARLASLGVPLACVTLAERGALVRRGDDLFHVPAEPVEVVDTTGAGDGFVAGLLAAIAGRGPIEALARADLERAVAFANRVAGRVCTRVGAVAGLPRAGDVSV
ncbi:MULTISPECIES: carbohydrate kinase [Anaeromyxobacter]|uniref:carbohydrate kinase family protein n=1 Tax=Anaeromyxobacter TaxID=161492 RepID=UPI001F589D7D|nr:MULTISPECIES: carbohydrate kinase [unclassified Anaeromyxobacter]